MIITQYTIHVAIVAFDYIPLPFLHKHNHSVLFFKKQVFVFCDNYFAYDSFVLFKCLEKFHSGS